MVLIRPRRARTADRSSSDPASQGRVSSLSPPGSIGLHGSANAHVARCSVGPQLEAPPSEYRGYLRPLHRCRSLRSAGTDELERAEDDGIWGSLFPSHRNDRRHRMKRHRQGS